MAVKSSGLIPQRSIRKRLAAYSVGLIVILTFMAGPAACWPPENQAPPAAPLAGTAYAIRPLPFLCKTFHIGAKAENRRRCQVL